MSQQPEAPEVAIEERRGISMVWLIPVVAGAIAIWLAYTTISEKGPEITISFKTAAGLEPGKTKVKFREVEVGVVDEVDIKDDLSGVVLKATLSIFSSAGHGRWPASSSANAASASSYRTTRELRIVSWCRRTTGAGQGPARWWSRISSTIRRRSSRRPVASSIF